MNYTDASPDDFSLKLFQWQQVAAVFRANDGIHLYIDGKEKGFTAVHKAYEDTPETEMIIGMNTEAVKPSDIHRQYGTLPYFYSIDGAIDRMRVYGYALAPGDLDYDVPFSLPENGSLTKRIYLLFPTAIDLVPTTRISNIIKNGISYGPWVSIRISWSLLKILLPARVLEGFEVFTGMDIRKGFLDGRPERGSLE